MMTADTPLSVNKTTAMQARTHLRSTIGAASSVRDINRVTWCSQRILIPAQAPQHRLVTGYACLQAKQVTKRKLLSLSVGLVVQSRHMELTGCHPSLDLKYWHCRHCRPQGARMPRPQQVRGVDHVQRAKAERGLPERAPGGLPRTAPARAAGGRAQARCAPDASALVARHLGGHWPARNR